VITKPNDRPYVVLDFGSRCSPRQTLTHRDLLRQHKCHIIGVDVKPGRNVDVVMKQPYRLPFRRNSADVIISGQAFEHIPFFWVSFLELARILRPGGYLFLTVPSRGHVHDVYDCWRYYPDGIRALGAFSGLAVLEARTDFPPAVAGRRHHDYRQVGHAMSYWGDTVGVFRKPAGRRSIPMMAARWTLRWWANRIGDLDEAAPVGANRQASPAALSASTLP
jgi:SAM-dependent methyltransferase